MWHFDSKSDKLGPSQKEGAKMKYSPMAIANSFLDLAGQNGATLCPMKIQKLVFFAHGWYLALKDDGLITEEVEAWKFGPVITSLYHEFKTYGSDPITAPAIDIEYVKDEKRFKAVKPKVQEDDDYVNALLQRIWEVYGKSSAVQLSNLTHLPGTPWYKARSSKQNTIPDEDIREYYKAQLKKAV